MAVLFFLKLVWRFENYLKRHLKTIVIANVFGSWMVHSVHSSLFEAIEEANDLITESQGGECYVVPPAEATRLVGQETTETRPKVWFDAQGNLRETN